MTDAERSEALTWVHAGRLRAAARELLSLMDQVTAIARDGRNPSGHGPRFTPLSPTSWARLEETVSELEELAGRVAEIAGPEPGAAANQGPAATRAAVHARLRQAQDTLADLAPEQLQRRYGSLPAAAAAELDALSGRMAAFLCDAQKIVDEDA